MTSVKRIATTAAIACASAIILFPCRNLWMGDGYTVRAMIGHNSLYDIIIIKDGGFFISPLAWVGLKSFGIAWAYICGAVYYAAVLAMTTRDRKWLVFACLPVVQVFAGYWEIYSAVYALSAVALWCIISERDNALPLVACLLLICHFVVGFPIVLLIICHLWHRRQYVSISIGVVCATYIVFAAIVFTRPSVWFDSPFGYYGALSVPHLFELVCLFTALFTWAVAIKTTLRWWTAFPAGVSVLMVCVIVPHLGMLRDWDLMSLCLLPVAFAVVYGARSVPVRSFIIAGAVTVAFIVFNGADRQATMLQYMKASPQYDQRFMGGHVLRVTQYIYNREVLGNK